MDGVPKRSVTLNQTPSTPQSTFATTPTTSTSANAARSLLKNPDVCPLPKIPWSSNASTGHRLASVALRIGINIGDIIVYGIIVYGDDIHGDDSRNSILQATKNE
jgi:hypothetical protein